MIGAPAPNATTPTLPARLTASRASTSATPSATSAFSRCAVPNAIDGERSSTIQVVSARSGTCRRTWGWPVRAVAAASRWRTSSPGSYGAQLRELGPAADADGAAVAGQIRARPAAPAATVERVDELRAGSGRGPGGRPAARAAAPGLRSSRHAGPRHPPQVVLVRLGHRDQDLLDHVIGRKAVAERLVGEHQPVAQDVGGEVAHVVGGHVAAAAEQRQHAGGLGEADRAAGAGAELDLPSRSPRPYRSGLRVASASATE